MLSRQISIRKIARAGVITITRPEALNAITFEMCMTVKEAMDRWMSDPDVKLILIEGEGDRAFSAGGDVEEIYRAGVSGDIEFSRRLWRNEYPFLASICDYPKPYVALMDGYVMGLGAGVSMHGSHRIVTERTLFAMPECAIGHIPDTGVSAHFAKAPGQLGKFIGMTGARLGPADTIYAGLADSFVPFAKLDALREALIQTGDPACIDEVEAEPPTGELPEKQAKVDLHFSPPTALEVVQAFESSSGSWERAQAKKIRAASPLSVACFFRVIDEVRKDPSVRNAVAWEFRYAYRSLSAGDFIEGVRAQIIDKDREPEWSVPTLEMLADRDVGAMLAELGAKELS